MAAGLRGPSLTLQIMLATALIGLVMLTFASFALLGNAKTAIQLEINAAHSLARDYVTAAVGSLMRSNATQQVVSLLPSTLYQPRHIKLSIIDQHNNLTHFPGQPKQDNQSDRAPDWFVRLLSPEPNELRLPVQQGNNTFSTVIITTWPEDEINEIWEDFQVFATIEVIAFVGTLTILLFVLRLALRPLKRIGQAFRSLEDGDFSTRIGAVPTVDFAPLAQRFDSLADTVERTLTEKDALNRRMVEAQDHERRTIAMELHDEFGPSYFGLRVEARAIRDAARDAGIRQLATRSANLLQIVEQMQTANKQLLARLRPMEIGALDLSEVLTDLVDRLRQLNPDLEWVTDFPDTFDNLLTEAEELQLYRITQEAITNTLRHARASRVSVTLSGYHKGEGVLLQISDDGIGWAGRAGGGIRGMHERALSLGGHLEISQSDPTGTVVTATLPLLDAKRRES